MKTIKITQLEFDSQVDVIVRRSRGDNEAIHGDIDTLLLETVKSFGIKLEHYDETLNDIPFWCT